MMMFVRIFLTKDIVPIHFHRFVDAVMALTYLHSRNSQIKLARVRYVSSIVLSLMKLFHFFNESL
eukprot:TRINITY_DN3190_c1_g1_i6.p1 TRINITY_DN3190_c1_g1~~TRINITY_DN3190_c1_g1_i6.p1  ORF type:complete len:65 (-),score=9.92 TRINITY_DN3190_c1_g1_i6:152-346(-)